MTTESKGLFEHVIFRYTRAQAIEDGVLIDVTATAAEAGFKIPTALTDCLWAEWIVPTDSDRAGGQSGEGRLWDVLNVLRSTLVLQKGNSDIITFEVTFVRDGRQQSVTLKSICGPGDEGEPVLTIMLPHED